MNYLKKYNSLFMNAVLALVSSAGIVFQFCSGLKTNGYLCIIIFFFSLVAVKPLTEKKEPRISILNGLYAFAVSIAYVFGDMAYNDSYNYGIVTLICLTGLTVTISGVLVYFIDFIEKNLYKKENSKTPDRKWFIIFFIFILCAYLPYFIKNRPIILTNDSMSEIYIATGQAPLSNFHPLIHTMIIKIFLDVFGYNSGLTAFALAQVVFMALTFAYTSYFIYKRSSNFIYAIISVLFFALYTTHATYSVTLWKDVSFGLFVLLMIIEIVKIIDTDGNYLKSFKGIVLFSIILLGVCFFRKNGIFAVIPLSVALSVYMLKKCKNTFAVFAGVLVLYFLVSGPLFTALKVIPSPLTESIAIPMQQISRVVKYNPDSLTESEKQLIEKVMPIEKIKLRYNYSLFDDIKFNKSYNDKVIEENAAEYIKLWARLAFKNPVIYIEAFLGETVGYWFLNMTHVPNIPFLNIVYSTGLIVWLTYFAAIKLIADKKYKYCVCVLPLMFIWLTVIAAAPAYAEDRYLYSFYTSLPLIFSLIIGDKKTEKNRQSIADIK